ncbi:FecR family protein [Persicitalea jodogahamensis]|uniref:Anti-sigma factor n=1 Tax=Persicitalea jodogahamensis TaxID=402147 RepID=A0A8J3G9D6_9BACT|nr:FecR family protein [Persicitalea jodogahamensis]GHB65404.1 anti-sigma factor [Persicitalea jodogahamensis]
MTVQEFDKLTERYLLGECSPEEIALLTNWADQAHSQSTETGDFLDTSEADDTEKRIWNRLGSEISNPIQRVFRKIQILPIWARAAAAAACVIIMTVFAFEFSRVPEVAQTPSQHGIETRNTANSKQKIYLADGSSVILEKNASIVVDENFGHKTRTVFLTGGAFFDIHRNEKVPFLVHSGGIVTEVLGTSFHIKPSSNGKSIEVSVKKGKVSVYTTQTRQSNGLDGVILTPNQKASFDTKLHTIRTGIVDSPQILVAPTPGSGFIFQEESIGKIIDHIREAYGVEIVLSGSGLRHCRFTGDLTGLPMYTQLKFICESVGAKLETRGTTIFILGESCL